MAGRPKRILIVCGTSIASSTMVAVKIEELLRQNRIKAEIRRALTSEARTASRDVDLIVATSQVQDVSVPVISGIPFITGIGIEEVEQEIIKQLRDS